MSTITLTIDDKQVSVPAGTTILEAAKNAGIEIPHYCYHPGLSIAGNCRMCLVDVEKMPKPMIGCNTTVSEGMIVHTNTPKVKQMQKSVMEFLLINHPLDCPTCDQSGECRLQDYYMSYDEVPSRFREEKVHKEKMEDIGAGVMLDQERCIACTRCVRFCKEVAGIDELALANRGDHVTITTFPGKKMENSYAGNVVDVCPVGALTSKDFRYKKRVWLLKKTPSICPGCSRGCNIEINHADSKVYRLLPRFNPDVNKYWMCDEGRYGYKSVNEDRLLAPEMKVKGETVVVSYGEALNKLAVFLRNGNPAKMAVVLHAGESNEVNQAFYDFAKNILGTSLVYYSRHEQPNPSFDSFLITADKNPNQKYIDGLKIDSLQKLKSAEGLLVLHDLSDADLAHVGEKRIPIFALWGANRSKAQALAQMLFPIPTYAEQEGHFTNVQGITQHFSQAYSPPGEAQALEYYLNFLGDALQGEFKQKQVV